MVVFTFPRKIIIQSGILNDLAEILENENIDNALLVTDDFLYNLLDKKLKLEKFSLFKDVRPEPSVDDIESAFQNLKGKNFDAIIALGGGSVIDFSKSLALKFSYPDYNLRELNPFENIKLKIKLITIPTTFSGSDVSFAVVLTDKNKKLPMGNYSLVPLIDIVDPEIMPKNEDLVRSTGVDAFVTAIEAIVSNTSNILTDALAEKSIRIVYDNLKDAMDNNENARENLTIASIMAGLAFSNSGSGLVHCLGHSFGSTFHIMHGTSVGLFLPYVIEFNLKHEETRKKYERIAGILDFNVDELVGKILEFFREIKQPVRVRDLNIDEKIYLEKLDEMVEKAAMDSELAFNPIFVSNDDIREIFIKALG